MRVIVAIVWLAVGCSELKKSKTFEAKVNLDRLYRGARAYYYDKTALPPSVAATPAPDACCKAGGKCAPDSSAWNDPSWTALRFSLDEPHYCSYAFESAGAGPTAAFTARAHCDLDCDGTFSTFEMVGAVGADGELPARATLLEENPLE